jgi:hypothetical protein
MVSVGNTKYIGIRPLYHVDRCVWWYLVCTRYDGWLETGFACFVCVYVQLHCIDTFV